jgi:hypothetical protein
MTEPPTPGVASQAVRLGGAKLDVYGDSLTGAVPTKASNTNTYRGEGIVTAFQKGRPLTFDVQGGTTLDVSSDPRLAQKLLVSQAMIVDKFTTGQLDITLPTVDKFLAAGFKLGDSGSISIGIEDTSGVGAETYILTVDASARYYGDFAHVTRTAAVTHWASCAADWWLDINEGSSYPREVIVCWMPKWSGR